VAAGDVITKVGTKDVNIDTPLLNALMDHQPGETVRVVLNRNGRIIETDVRLGKRV
jgi:S1-C subfamily serine protease